MFVIRVIKFGSSLRSTDFGSVNVKCFAFTKTADPPKRSNACHIVVLHFQKLAPNKLAHLLKVNCERCQSVSGDYKNALTGAHTYYSVICKMTYIHTYIHTHTHTHTQNITHKSTFLNNLFTCKFNRFVLQLWNTIGNVPQYMILSICNLAIKPSVSLKFPVGSSFHTNFVQLYKYTVSSTCRIGMLPYKLNMQDHKLTINKHAVLLETSRTSLLVLPVFTETTKFGNVTEMLNYKHHIGRNRTVSVRLYIREGIFTGTNCTG